MIMNEEIFYAMMIFIGIVLLMVLQAVLESKANEAMQEDEDMINEMFDRLGDRDGF